MKNLEHSKRMTGKGNPMYGKKRPKQSERMSGKGNSMYGKKHTEVTREKIRIKSLARFKDKSNHPCFGKPRTEITKRRIGNAAKLRFADKRNHPCYGKHKSEETKRRLSISNSNNIGMPGDKNPSKRPEVKEKMRVSAIKRIRKQLQREGKVYSPTVGKNETKVLDFVEKQLNIKILRQYVVSGYFLDGYCPEKNLAFEIDENSHYLRRGLKKCDILRQNYIQQKLGCNFIRIRDKYVNLIH